MTMMAVRRFATFLGIGWLAMILPVSSAMARHGDREALSAYVQQERLYQQQDHQRDFRRQEYDSRQRVDLPMRQQQRLSPDERRQLRRDIQDAGREIYPVRRW